MSDKTLPPVEFTTGFAPLPDVGAIEYNGVTFSSLFASKLDWKVEQDLATRTTKWVEVTIEAVGVVTLGFEQQTIDAAMKTIRTRLAQDAGILRYTGRGFGTDMVVNQPGGRLDLNWGPKTEVMSFEPLGGSRSAMVHWRVTTWVSEMTAGGANVVQFNNEVSITFDEDFYAGFVIKGTLEIGLTRPSVNTRTLTTTVDQLREQWLTFIANSIDLKRYRVVKRSFNVSRDRRVLDWEFAAAELPPTVMPASCPTAHGSFRFQPLQKGVGHIQWICSLRTTYEVDKRYPRRVAWFHFVIMLWFRMMHSRIFGAPATPSIAGGGAGGAARGAAAGAAFGVAGVIAGAAAGAAGSARAGTVPPADLETGRARARQLLEEVQVGPFTPASAVTDMQTVLQRLANKNRGLPVSTALLISISGEEGLYLDAKTVTFEAQWRMTCTLDAILLGTGFWRYQNMQGRPPVTIGPGGGNGAQQYTQLNNMWAMTMQDIAGWKSWLAPLVDPAGSAIIDFGSEGPPIGSIVGG